MRNLSQITIVFFFFTLADSNLHSQSSGGRAVQVRATSSRPSVRGVRGFNSTPKSWLLTKPSKKPSTSPPAQTGGGTNQGKEKTQRITTRLPKRLFSFGNWMPGNIPGMQQQGWICGVPMPQPGQQNGLPPAGMAGVPAPQPRR